VEKGSFQKPLKREFSAGGVVFKKATGEFIWLITKSNPSDRIPDPVWRLPKGWIDNAKKDIPGDIAKGLRRGSEDEIQKAAIREVAEEGGIEASIIQKLGTIKFFFQLQEEKILKFVTFYLMRWQKDLPQGFGDETLEVGWFPFKEAYKKLKYSGEKDILKKANETIGQGVQADLV